jgi:hypothetical protein
MAYEMDAAAVARPDAYSEQIGRICAYAKRKRESFAMYAPRPPSVGSERKSVEPMKWRSGAAMRPRAALTQQ